MRTAAFPAGGAQGGASSSPRRRAGGLALLLLAALGVRLYNLQLPPLNFEPERQFRAALMARKLYFAQAETAAAWRREVAAAQRWDSKEPAAMQYLAYLGYRLAGGEHLWIPQGLAAIFWVAGGAFLWGTAGRLAGSAGAWWATVYYLFFPFGWFISRSFQPESLMIMTFCAGLYAMVRYGERPSRARLILCGAVCGLAILVKFVTIFALTGAWLLSERWAGRLRDRRGLSRTLVFGLLSLAPGLVYYGYGVFISQSIAWVAEQNFQPQLWRRGFFWQRWGLQTARVVGYLPGLAGLAGVWAMRDRRARALLLGLWAGFAAYGLTFPYGVQLVPYWNVQIGPLAALGLAGYGRAAAGLWRRLSRCGRVAAALAGMAVAVAAAGAALVITPQRAKNVPLSLTAKNHIESACLWAGIDTRLVRQVNTTYQGEVQRAQEIGQAVGHSTRTLFLADYYGYPLQYYAEIAGRNWPRQHDFRMASWMGRLLPPTEQLFEERRRAVGAEYFIVADWDEYERQPELKRLLEGRFPAAGRGDGYVIFDLRALRQPPAAAHETAGRPAARKTAGQ